MFMIRVVGQEMKLSLGWRRGSIPVTCIALSSLFACFCEGRGLLMKSLPVL